MKAAVCVDHCGGDPGPGGAGAKLAAGFHDGTKGPVAGDPERFLLQELSHAAGDPQIGGKEDAARIGRPPEDRLAFGIPGKDPLGIGAQEALRGEVAADGEKSGKVDVISVVYGDKAADVRRFFEEKGGDWTVLDSDDGRTALDWGVAKVPESFLVSPTGVVVERFQGGVVASDVEDLIATYEDQAAGSGGSGSSGDGGS